MPLSMNEIKARAAAFANRWRDASREEADAQEFEIDFLNVFGVARRKVATFEKKVRKLDGKNGYVDLFWPGALAVEMKSRGKDLDKAYEQAREYLEAFPQHELPRGVLICDFERFHFYDLDANAAKTEFTIDELPGKVELFAYLAGYQKRVYREQDPANFAAAEAMGRLHDRLKEVGYLGRELEIYLARLMFCMFADDAAIFDKDDFLFYLRDRTAEDGSDLAAKLDEFFYVLNTPPEKRLRNLDERLAAFPYINGGLFAERLSPASFDAASRQILIECCELDWGQISPSIFGALFQCAMDPRARRNLGAHYTSEKNILKALHPLFLDDLRAELDKVKALKIGRLQRLKAFHDKLASIKILDPACGCGNFLVVAYRELRLLELEVLKEINANGERFFDISSVCKVNVDQFFGIEIEEFPAQIARLALWLTDHQMNLKVRDAFGEYMARIPLTTAPTIVCADALRIDWREVVSPSELNYVVGNPPFVGARMASPEQKAEILNVFAGTKNAGNLDYVTCWHRKAAEFIQGTRIEVAFVSTNSICQGEQAAILWEPLVERFGVKINFAHQTFKWSNEARANAAVFCIIVGFATFDRPTKTLYVYDDVRSEPHARTAKGINAYLVDAPNVAIKTRSKPICNVPLMNVGNQPIDGGNYLFTKSEMEAFVQTEPNSARWFKPWYGSFEFINSQPRYFLFLKHCPPNELKKLPECLKRVEAVAKFREESKRPVTRELAKTPREFAFENMPGTNFLLVPKVSSERRKYAPVGFMNADVLASDLVFVVPNATLYHFGVLTSGMHMAWTRYVCGRLKSDYRYSSSLVYNNFPWPEADAETEAKIADAAQGVLDARAAFPNSSLADLYDPVATPPALIKAHEKLDRLVERAYRKPKFDSDAERVAFLFERYLELTKDLTSTSTPKKTRRSPTPSDN